MFKTWLKQYLAVFICLITLSSIITPAYASSYDYILGSQSTDSDNPAKYDADYYFINGEQFQDLFDFTISDLNENDILSWVFDFKTYTVIKRYSYDGLTYTKCYFNTPNLQSILKNRITKNITDGYTDNTYDVNETQWIVDVGKSSTKQTVITKYGFNIPSYTYMGEYPKEDMTLAGIVPGVEEKWYETLWRAVKALFGCSFLKAPTADNFNTIAYYNHTYTEKSDYIREFFKRYYIPYLEGKIIAGKAYDLGDDSDSASENANYFDSPEELMALTTTKSAYRSAKTYNEDHRKFYEQALQHYIWWKAYTENTTGDTSDTDSSNDGYSFTNLADGKWLDENNWPPTNTDTDTDFRNHLINFDFLDNSAESDSDIYTNEDLSSDIDSSSDTSDDSENKALEILNLLVPGSNKWSIVENSKVTISADIYAEAKSDMILDGWHFIASRERYRDKAEEWINKNPVDAYIFLNSIPNDSDTDSEHAIYRNQYDGEQNHTGASYSFVNSYSKLSTPKNYGLTTSGLTTPEVSSSGKSGPYENYEYLQVASITADILRYSYDYLKCHFLYDIQEKFTITYQKKVTTTTETWKTYKVNLLVEYPVLNGTKWEFTNDSEIKTISTSDGIQESDHKSTTNVGDWKKDNTRNNGRNVEVNWYTKQKDINTDILYKDVMSYIDSDTEFEDYFGKNGVYIENNLYDGKFQADYYSTDNTVLSSEIDYAKLKWDINGSVPSSHSTGIDTDISELNTDTEVLSDLNDVTVSNCYIKFKKDSEGNVESFQDDTNPDSTNSNYPNFERYAYNENSGYINNITVPILYRNVKENGEWKEISIGLANHFDNEGNINNNGDFSVPVEKFEEQLRRYNKDNIQCTCEHAEQLKNFYAFFNNLYSIYYSECGEDGSHGWSVRPNHIHIKFTDIVEHEKIHTKTERRYLIHIENRKSNYRYQYSWDGKSNANKTSDRNERGPVKFTSYLKEFDFNRYKDIDLSENLAYNPNPDDTDTEDTNISISSDSDIETDTDMSKAINRYLAKKDPRDKSKETFNLDDVVPQDLQAIYNNFEHNVQLISNYRKFNNYIGRGIYYDNNGYENADASKEDDIEKIRTLPYRQCMIENRGTDNECWSDEFGDGKTSITLANVIVYSDVYKVTGEGKDHARITPTDSDYDSNWVKDHHCYQYRREELTNAEATAILNRLQEYCGPYYEQVVSNMIKLMCATANYDDDLEPSNFVLKDDPRVMPYDTGTMIKDDSKHYEVKDPRVELYKKHIVGSLVSFSGATGSIGIYLKVQPKMIEIAGKLTEISVFLQSICDFEIFEDNGLSPTDMWKEKAYAELAILALILLWLVKTIIAIFKLGKEGSIRILIAALIVLLEVGAISSITSNPTPTWNVIKSVSEKFMFLGSVETASRNQNGIGYLFGSSDDTKDYEVFYYLPYLDIWSKYNTGYGLLEKEQKMDEIKDIEINAESEFKNPQLFDGIDIKHYSILLADSFNFYGKSDSVVHSSVINGEVYNGLTINNNAYRVVDHFMAPRVKTDFNGEAYSLEVTENPLYNGEFQGSFGSVLTKLANCLLGCFLSIIKVMIFIYFWWQLYIFTFNVLLGIGVERKKLSTILAETFMPIIALCLFDVYSNICLTLGMTVTGIAGLFVIIFMFWLTIIIIRWWHDVNNGLVFPFTLNWIYALSSISGGNKRRNREKVKIEAEIAYRNAGIQLTQEQRENFEELTKVLFNEDGTIKDGVVNTSSNEGKAALESWYQYSQNYARYHNYSNYSRAAIDKFESDERFKDIVERHKGKSIHNKNKNKKKHAEEQRKISIEDREAVKELDHTIKCPKCSDKFNSVDELSTHMKNVHGREHKCPYCNTWWSSVDDVKAHINRKHSQTDQQDDQQNNQ